MAPTVDILALMSSRKRALIGFVVLCIGVILWAPWRTSEEVVGDPQRRETGADALVGSAAAVDRDDGSERALGQRSRLAGRVLDLEDAPVAQAQVCVGEPGDLEEEEVGSSTAVARVTDDSARCREEDYTCDGGGGVVGWSGMERGLGWGKLG